MAHKQQEQLIEELHKAKKKVEVGSRYFHYKHPNQFYKVIAVGFIEDIQESCVVYQAEYGEKITWVRTLKEFLAKVTQENGSEFGRFTKVE